MISLRVLQLGPNVFHWEFCPSCGGNQTTAVLERDRWVLRCRTCTGAFVRADWAGPLLPVVGEARA